MDPAQRRYLEGLSAGLLARSAKAGHLRIPATALPTSAPPPGPAVTEEERCKRELHPLDAFPRLLACAEGNVPPDTGDRFRFRWFGLSYLAPEKDGFRLRLRVPGGMLRTYQVREAADIAREQASGGMEINRYAGLDLQTITLPDAPEALRRAEAAGLTPRGAGGDNVRAILSNPLTGLHRGEDIDVGPLVTRLEQCLAQSREFSDLPRSCVVAFHGGGCGEEAAVAESDLLFATRPGQAGFRIRLAGLGDIGTSLRPDQAVHACIELLRIYSREADRTDRERARLRNFYGTWDRERLVTTLEKRLGAKLLRDPANPADNPDPGPAMSRTMEPAAQDETIAIHPQKQPGLYAVRVAAPQGRWLSAQWEEIAHLADMYASGRLRLTGNGALFVVGVLESQLKPLRERLGPLVSPW